MLYFIIGLIWVIFIICLLFSASYRDDSLEFSYLETKMKEANTTREMLSILVDLNLVLNDLKNNPLVIDKSDFDKRFKNCVNMCNKC